MAEKLDPAVIKKTQDTLGRVIQAPALTEKLLSRPPVQFIQDIVKSVIKNTGFMKGLYKSEELESAFIKEGKENKLLFLTKLITIVNVVVNDQLGVKASKIAAGAEIDKTNGLFQNLAKAINMKPDNDEVVKKALKKLKSGDSDEKPKEEKEPKKEREKDRDREKSSKPSGSKDRERSRDAGTREKPKEEVREDRNKESRDRDRAKDGSKREDRDKTRDRGKERDGGGKERERDKDKEREPKDKEKSRDKDRESKDKDKDRESKDKDRERRHRDRDGEKEGKGDKEEDRKHRDSSRRDKDPEDKDKERRSKREEKGRSKENADEKEEPAKSIHTKITYEEEEGNQSENEGNASRKRPTSAKGPRSHIDREDSALANQGSAETDETMRSSLRPTTARPGAPRPKLINEPEELTQSKIHTSSKAKSTLIVNSDSDDDFVVKEQKVQEDERKQKFHDLNNDNDLKGSGLGADQEHGALVKKILESKEQLEYGSELNRNKDNKPSVQNDLQRKKDRERIQKEIDKLKESIQTLTKASIPLGRTLEFLQEDIEMMQKELVKWTDESENNLKAFKRQQAEAQSLLEPYKGALADIENQISDQSEKIASVKRKILLNEEKTSKLLFSIGKQN